MWKHSNVLSKFQKSARRAAAAAQTKPELEELEVEEPRELHDLVPIPQPAREPTPEYRQTFSTLPPWLEKPVNVPSTKRAAFTELGINEKSAKHLADKGFAEAFAVQCALIPRLMYNVQHPQARPNDICVSAPTGSGKTLGYALPVVESLRSRQDVRRLRAVVVVPTRELVEQAASTFRKCMVGSSLKIGTSIGNQSFLDEQRDLIAKETIYNPKEYQRLMTKVRKRQQFEYDSEDDAQDETREAKAEQLLTDAVQTIPLHVVRYDSAVDVLVCTPGRLVEHLQNTLGFNLDHLQWLIIDEADRLLDQSFQDWVKHINNSLDKEVTDEVEAHFFPDFYRKTKRYVRKVILSATMTRDISQLSALNLRRPTMIVVRTEQGATDPDTVMTDGEVVEVNEKGEYELPGGLTELVLPVSDGSEKPLFLLELLKDIFSKPVTAKQGPAESDSDDSSSSSSESDSSDSASDSESDSDSLSSSSDSSMFASSTSEAHRLHHLLTSLLPSVVSPTPPFTLLTKAHTSLPSALTSNPSQPRIIISTDRASRGLDLPLTHVVNYTIPRSLESYVHRVGRTARAGREGKAWSLVRDVEARWFWNDVARTEKVRRPRKAERKRVSIGKMWKEGSGKEEYRRVLEEMSRLVEG
ncbi:P-loop containing nucleoside triphosphate hydrolase protein, partial [Myriangium duriaei CBS 260.36]